MAAMDPLELLPRRIGLDPWLPWPLSASRWWTAPVRAERLAILRIGLAAVLVWDVAANFLPNRDTFFGDDGPGAPRLLAAGGRSPAWAWSLLRGVNDPLTSHLALLALLGATVVALLGLWAYAHGQGAAGTGAPQRTVLIVWAVAAVVWTFGVWARLTPPGEDNAWLVLGAPVMVLGGACLFGILYAYYRRIRRGPPTGDLPWLALCLAAALTLLVLGWLKEQALLADDPEGPAWLTACFQRFDGNPDALFGAMVLWLAAAVLLLLGVATRVSAVLAWLLTVEFMHLNFTVCNGGDVVRVIVLFYLMLSPCGAAWSVDAWLRRARTGDARPVLVPPWPLRLLFIQMVMIYLMNGLYKWPGDDWREGLTLYYVLQDPGIAHFPYEQLPVPLWALKLSTWMVLGWEIGFPLWVALPWTRKPALWLGVLFHVGIWVTLELGGFAPYMLTLYLPLLLPRLAWEGPPAVGERLPSDAAPVEAVETEQVAV